jgi:hypothetical protein
MCSSAVRCFWLLGSLFLHFDGYFWGLDPISPPFLTFIQSSQGVPGPEFENPPPSLTFIGVPRAEPLIALGG